MFISWNIWSVKKGKETDEEVLLAHAKNRPEIAECMIDKNGLW